MDIVLETQYCRLTIGDDCLVRSLVLKQTGEELADAKEELPFFSVTQDRPFNNEIKLSHPNKHTVYRGTRLRREGDALIVGFETAPYEARVSVREAGRYLSFTLEDFIVKPSDYGGLCMTPPPAAEFRLIELPVREGEGFGEWLNVSWHKNAAVCVLATSPHARIDSERRGLGRIMTADAVRGIKLRGCGAAVIAAPKREFLRAIDDLERDYGLPRGAKGRRNAKRFLDNTFFTADINPGNVDAYLDCISRCGFRKMQIYYTAIFREEEGYSLAGNYDYRPEYPNGKEDLRKMLEKIRAAGILPGIHFLQTHIGLKSRYVSMQTDHRINLTQRFTLARPVGAEDSDIYVEENTEGAEMHPRRRVLRFGGELISYEGHTGEYPYRFTGCRRGAFGTTVSMHPAGEIGGILDISEFGGTSAYIDQNTDLQDEIAAKLADAYDAGFGFIYFDGSEGANIPYEYHVPNAQYRVLKHLGSEPLFTEGAAKAHFSWHFLTRGNAFDIFAPDLFKSAIDSYPAEEAPRMRLDLTCVDFGWWNIRLPGTPSGTYEYQKKLFRDERDSLCGTQADHFEYGAARAAGWDCPVTIQFDLETLAKHPRRDDLLEVLRRWQALRDGGYLGKKEKEFLRKPGNEVTLLIGENGTYELAQITRLDCGDDRIRAFLFERGGKRYVQYWHVSGEGRIRLNVKAADLSLAQEIAGPWEQASEDRDGSALLPAGAKRYLRFENAGADPESAFRETEMV